MNEIILAIIVVLILLLILASLFLFTIKRVNILVKKIFVDKLQEYDFLIEDKEKKVEELNSNIETKRTEQKELDEVIEKLKQKQEEFKQEDVEISMPSGADFEDGNILEGYKKIKEGFDFDYDQKIKDFLKSEIVEESNYFDELLAVRAYFTHKTIYKISTYSSKEQKIIIDGLLNEEEKGLIKDLLNVTKFNIVKFVNRLDEKIKKEDPTIYIYVSEKSLNFNRFHKNIRTLYDKKLTEGFRIEYKGKIYDYSI